MPEDFDYQTYEFAQSEEEFKKLEQVTKEISSRIEEIKALREARACPWYK